MRKKKINQFGLTLIELLAVIAIIAILFILLIPTVSSAFEKARISGVQTDFRSYQIAGKSYFMEQLGKTKTESGFNDHLDKPLQFTDRKSKELNPWGNPYELEITIDGLKVITKESQSVSISDSLIYAENVRQYELILKEVDGEFISEIKGFEGAVIGEASSKNESTNQNDFNKDGYDDRANVEKSVFTYSDNADGTINITGYSGSVSEVVLPAFIDGKKVVSIDDYAFYPSSSSENGKNTGVKLTSINIPNGVTSIGMHAFHDNNITYISIPNSVTTIKRNAFNNNKITSVIIPNNLTSIGDLVFCNNKITSISIPNSVTTIGSNAFYNNQLTSVIIPNGVTVIGSDAFHANKLTSVTIPNSVKSIDGSAFAYNQLSSITIPNSVESIGNGAFYSNKLTSLVIPNSVKRIGASAFAINQLNTLTIPNSISKIEHSAFHSNLLTNVILPNSITSIEDYAFYDNNLTEISLPSSINSIGYKSFFLNPNLLNVNNGTNLVVSSYFDSSPIIRKTP